MKSWNNRPLKARLVVPTCVVAAALCLLSADRARAGERKFLVILATSPKEFADSGGVPPGGFPSRQQIHDQYFDLLSPSIGSFAEYWEEISYGDVTVSGLTTDWLSLPWAISRESARQFYDINTSGTYDYGASEQIRNFFTRVRIDLDGDPGAAGVDNGPFSADSGSFDTSREGYLVWRPGERFVDLDGDGKWDGLDEANNQMDFFFNGTNIRLPDGRPDLLGPWVDLNKDLLPENESNCEYLPDSDNDGNPDCAPSGSAAKGSCPTTTWTIRVPGSNITINDCNGNLIPDACDIDCNSPACFATGWCADHPGKCTGSDKVCGTSVDQNPITDNQDGCSTPTLDGIPDECQYAGSSANSECADRDPQDQDLEDPCAVVALACTPLPQAELPVPIPRCEFDDANDNGKIDIVEPFENFIRRWDPCMFDPDVSSDNFFEDPAHWIKVYDPNSSSSTSCFNPSKVLVYAADTTSHEKGDPLYQRSYIQNNYPGDWRAVEAQARKRMLWGPRDPGATGVCQCDTFCNDDSDCPGSGTCDTTARRCNCVDEPTISPDNAVCGTSCTSDADCSRESTCDGDICRIRCEYDGDCPGTTTCDFGSGLCRDECPGASVCDRTLGLCRLQITGACPAGFHAQFDAPDDWKDVPSAGPDGPLYITKMRAVAGTTIGTAEFFRNKYTPEPTVCSGSGDQCDTTANCSNGESCINRYEMEWKDRYAGGPNHPLNKACTGTLRPCTTDNDCIVAGVQEDVCLDLFVGCENAEYDRSLPEGPDNEPFVECEPPDWPTRAPNVMEVVPFDDTDPELFDDDVVMRRRFFKANAGGLNGDGTGWFDNCGQGAAARNVVFESGLFSEDPFSFVSACNAPILPDELANGEETVGEFFDGWVEHDDLPSSKYHKAGDERLGEVTSPFNDAIWGEDRGAGDPNSTIVEDGRIAAAGPYARHIHGTSGRDAGNLLTMELLTWRTEPPFNNGIAWELGAWERGNRPTRFHPYAGPSGGNFGFRDYNLDGLIDQGEVRPAGSENYIIDSHTDTGDNGTDTFYPFNRRRLVEDCIEILDVAIDFDDFVDADAMNSTTGCSGALSVGLTDPRAPFPIQYATGGIGQDIITASGILSGIVLLPPGAPVGDSFPRISQDPAFYPIHIEDGLNDPKYADANLPPGEDAQLSWHLFVQDLVLTLSDDDPSFDTGSTADLYLHQWENFPDLFDYDVFGDDPINCPMAGFDIQAAAGLIHPVPPMKERTCTDWARAIDLTTVLTPGVEKILTLPPAERVRDDSYYFIENDAFPGERFYFWSAGSGFDEPGAPPSGGMPGKGVLILHVAGGNIEAAAQQQRFPPFGFVMVQADGLGELDAAYANFDDVDALPESCPGVPDDGDVWPGSTGNTVFNCDTLPASRWYTQNACTGLEISNIVLDDDGGALVTLKWNPQSIPSLEFIDPPGGVSVQAGSKVIYDIRANVTDVFGGTTVKFYYIKDERECSGNGAVCESDADCSSGQFCTFNTATDSPGATLIGTRRKTTPGRTAMSLEWDIKNVPDGRYRVFAHLIPGPGADGTESASSKPRPGRNNVGEGAITVGNVADTARLETWTLTLVDIRSDNTQDWRVNSTLTQPIPSEDAPDQDPWAHLLVDPITKRGTYTSVGGELTFTLHNTGTPFAVGDTWRFVTTGITAPSATITIEDGQINEAPTAVIGASPLTGDPPLKVSFDGRNSFDPNGIPLEHLWDFGDGSPQASGAVQTHTYTDARTFTVVLRVTNPVSGLFGETSVDISVTNNSPNAAFNASPLSGKAPLEVSFDASQSSDTETPDDRLIYQWVFGDGTSANAAGTPGILISTSHRYAVDPNFPCAGRDADLTGVISCYTATLAVTDTGGKSSVDSIDVEVGNTLPVASVSTSTTQGPAPLLVRFNATSSFDADGDELEVEWNWGDGTPTETHPPGGTAGGGGSIAHTYENEGQFSPTAIVRDDKGGESLWSGTTITVSKQTVGKSDPQAIITIVSALPFLVNDEIEVNGELSFDNPDPGVDKIVQYLWDWDDGSSFDTGITAKHTYTELGTYVITLTVSDAENPPNSSSTSQIVTVVDQRPNPADNSPPNAEMEINPSSGFAGKTRFTFDASRSSDPDGDALSFQWVLGNGKSAVGKVVTAVYDSPGTYTVRLIARDGLNAISETSRTVTVRPNVGNAKPQANIGTGPRSGLAPLTLTFNGSNSFDPDEEDTLSYEWLVDGDVVGTDATVTIEFKNPGTYTVVLRVSDGILTATSAPEIVTVTAPGDVPPGTGVPGGGGGVGAGGTGELDSAAQRPTGGTFCGFGMVLGLFGSLIGLFSMVAARRRVGI